MENLENILESILFVNGDAIDIADITSKIDVDKNQIKNAVKKLKEKYNDKAERLFIEKMNVTDSEDNEKKVPKTLDSVLRLYQNLLLTQSMQKRFLWF